MTMHRIGVDIGGTFTDFLFLDGRSGESRLHKKLTTPDPSDAALEGLAEVLDQAGVAWADVGEIIHGTTLVTNAIIERKGARLGLITTAGFRDILEMGTEQRYAIYDLFLKYPDPLVPRNLRLEVAERMDRDGRIVTPIDRDAVRRTLRTLVEAGVEAVAVCFLHSYRNPEHEHMVRAIANEEFPDLAVSLSVDVVPEIGEYQRCVTTAVNAYVQPLVDRYLKRFEQRLRSNGYRGVLRLMHSAGGLVPIELARAFPVRLLESGPAGGVLAAAKFAAWAGKRDAISFDMGGTTAKTAIIIDGEVTTAALLEAGRIDRFRAGSGLPIKVPVIDLIETGAGGGSIAAVDSLGLLKVGPQSAGSSPGPACYGAGGTFPTVTDANVALGYYDPEFFLGGEMKLDRPAAEAALGPLGDALGLSTAEAAWGVHRMVVEGMAAATRIHVVEQGQDPRRFAMIAFGGAGPAHAADIARTLGIREVIVPPACGAASALGFLAGPLSFEQVRACPSGLSAGFDPGAVNGALAALEKEGRDRILAAGVAADDTQVTRFADMRLVGQLHNVTVPLPNEELDDESVGAIMRGFQAAYTARFSKLYSGAKAEIVNIRVRCSGPLPALSSINIVGGSVDGPKVKGTRPAWFENQFVETTVYDRYRLVRGDSVAGPAIVEEPEATTVIPPGDVLTVDEVGNLRIEINAAAAAAVRITTDMEVAEAAAIIDSDPVALEIMWSRLETITKEMSNVICRTAFSNLISEIQDFACDLLDANGEVLVHAPKAMPAFNLTLPNVVKALLEEFPANTLEPGDVLVTNDPWLCAGHLYDIAVVTPVFAGGRLVGLAASVGDVSEIGGTKDWRQAREIYEEGFQIPPMKLFEAGAPNAALFRLLSKNIRMSEQVLGDIHALVGANQLGADRLVAFMAEYGLQDLRALANVIQGRSESALLAAIREIPEGTYRAEATNRPFGQILRYPIAITVADERISVDFTGAPPQLPQGAYNATISYTAAEACFLLKCLLTPDLRGNAGDLRRFSVTAPRGSILNATYPAACNMRARTGWYMPANFFSALAEVMPEKVQSASGIAYTSNVYGRDKNDRMYYEVFFMGGGQGASVNGDGKAALMWPSSATCTSVELFEARSPMLVLEKTLVPDTGGAGRYRGGPGQRVRYRKLDDDGLVTFATAFPENRDPVPGLFGGKSGGTAHARLLRPDGALIRDLGVGERLQLRSADEVIEVLVAGGAGYGEPSERDPGAIEHDMALGIVTKEGAERDYGYRKPMRRAS